MKNNLQSIFVMALLNVSADGKLNYRMRLGKQNLLGHVCCVNRILEDKFVWGKTPSMRNLKPGQFGCDLLASRLIHGINEFRDRRQAGIPLNETTEKREEKQIAKAIHRGWKEMYLFWKEHNPGETNAVFYRNPEKQILVQDERDFRTIVAWDDLPLEVKLIDIEIAKYIISLNL